MPILTPIAPSGQYHDRKRYAWMLSLLVPALSASGPFLYYATHQTLALWVPVLLSYFIFPLIDLALGKDRYYRYYRYVTYALAPLLWAGLVGGAWFFTAHRLPWHAWLAGACAVRDCRRLTPCLPPRR